MNLNEIKLYKPVKRHFEAMGFTIYCEVPILNRVVDVVALKNPQIITIELKVSYCKRAHRQAHLNGICADKSYIAVRSKPRVRSISKCQKSNIGLLLVRGAVEVLAEAINNQPHEHYRRRITESCSRSVGNTIAGLPCQKGIGPAIDVSRAVDDYRKTNPNATWKQIYRDVANHYASAASMKQSLEKHRHFQYLLEKYKHNTCGECDRQKWSCPKGRNRRDGSKACINFINETGLQKQVVFIEDGEVTE